MGSFLPLPTLRAPWHFETVEDAQAGLDSLMKEATLKGRRRYQIVEAPHGGYLIAIKSRAGHIMGHVGDRSGIMSQPPRGAS